MQYNNIYNELRSEIVFSRATIYSQVVYRALLIFNFIFLGHMCNKIVISMHAINTYRK